MKNNGGKKILDEKLFRLFLSTGTPLTQLSHVNDKTDTGTLAGKHLIITGTVKFIIQYCLHNYS